MTRTWQVICNIKGNIFNNQIIFCQHMSHDNIRSWATSYLHLCISYSVEKLRTRNIDDIQFIPIYPLIHVDFSLLIATPFIGKKYSWNGEKFSMQINYIINSKSFWKVIDALHVKSYYVDELYVQHISWFTTRKKYKTVVNSVHITEL